MGIDALHILIYQTWCQNAWEVLCAVGCSFQFPTQNFEINQAAQTFIQWNMLFSNLDNNKTIPAQMQKCMHILTQSWFFHISPFCLCLCVGVDVFSIVAVGQIQRMQYYFFRAIYCIIKYTHFSWSIFSNSIWIWEQSRMKTNAWKISHWFHQCSYNQLCVLFAHYMNKLKRRNEWMKKLGTYIIDENYVFPHKEWWIKI